MQTQSRHIGEQWAYVRDRYKGDSENAARELFHICKVEFLPPSKAHLRRNARAKALPLVVKRRAEIAKAKPHIEAFNANRDRALGIAAINSPNRVQAKRRGTSTLEANPEKRAAPFVSKPMFSAKHSSERAAPNPRRTQAAKRHLEALGKMVYKPFVPTLDQWCDIFALFGSYDNWERAIHPR